MTRFRRQQRGSLLLYGLLTLAILATLSGIAYKIRESGKDAIRAEWAEADRKAQAAADAARLQREAEAQKAVIALQQADRRADDAESKWRAARRASAGVPLAVCPTPSHPAPGAPAATVASPDAAPSLRLTYSFVRQWDAAWIGQNGQPVWPQPDTGSAPDGTVRPDPATASPYGLGEALDTHGENAARCSTDRRNYAALVALIKRLRADWK